MSGKPIVSKHVPNLDALISTLQSNPDKPYTAKDLAPYLTCKPSSVYIYLRAAVAYYPDNVKKKPVTRDGQNGTFVGYYWTGKLDPADDIGNVEPEQKSSRKNKEGYQDMTACKAIENCEKATLPATTLVSSKYAGKDGHRPLPGDIWLTSTSSKAEEYFLVLSNHDNTNTISGLRLSKETPAVKKLIPIPFDFSIVMDNGDAMIADASMVTYKWRKYMTKLVEAISDNDLNILKGKIRVSLGITEATRVEYVEKPVYKYKEKIVEKKVEVPVEKIVYADKPVEIETPKIPEGCVSEEAFNAALLRQERDIWKSVAENLMKRI
jgi:hypothetical protein